MKNSGPDWCDQFPTGHDLADLSAAFAPRWQAFEACLKAGGASVTVNATRRPKARAYLMHWSWMVARENYDPAKIPAFDGVDIQWNHPTAKAAAEQMVEKYEISYEPALDSSHIRGDAIDCNISWKGTHLFLTDVHGNKVSVDGLNNDQNPKLWEVGAGFGVLKLPKDHPHWSLTGH